MATAKVTRNITTPTGRVCFPHLTMAQATANKNDKDQPVYDLMLLIPKSERDALKAIVGAISEVAEAKWGENWKKAKVRIPLRDGDKEQHEATEDGSTKGEKYPERLGHYFINARSTKPVGVVDRQRVPITSEDGVYGGCYAKANIDFYPYQNSGNSGVGASLNGVQFIRDGEAFGGGRPAIESMFDLLEDEDGDDLLGDTDSEPEPAKPAKKAAAKKAAAKTPAPAEDDLVDLTGDDGDDDPFADLDD